MKTKRMIAVGLLNATAMVANAQDWNRIPGGDVIGSTEYVGAAAASTVPFHLQTVPNLPIHFSTNSVNRMRLMETNTTGTINTYTPLNLSGFLGLGNFSTPLVPQPFAFIHIDDGGIQDSGFRPWMRQGTLITHNSDQGYFGLKDEGQSRNHTVMSWSDNDIWDPGPDRLKFIFVANNVGATGTAGTLDGLEAARFTPHGTGNESFFGIGDWFTAGGGLEPNERLDLLDRTIRLRNFMTTPPIGSGTDYESTSLENVLVVDPSDGRVHWRHLANWTGSGACDWDITGINDVVTCYNPFPGPNCPANTNNVAIGTAVPTARLEVIDNVAGPLAFEDVGVRVRVGTPAPTVIGTNSGAAGSGSQAIGVEALGSGAARSYGVRGFGANSNYKIGVYGEANLSSPGAACSEFAVGVYGQSIPVAGCPGNPYAGGWAAWFNGVGFINAPFWVYSDPSLKDNIQPITSCTSILGQLDPKTYSFRTADFPGVGLPGGLQSGLLSTEVEQVLPHLVRDVAQPAVLDSLGNEISPAMDLKAMNYEGLIPYTIGAINEQQATIVQLNDRIATLEQQVAACCANDGSNDQRSMSGGTGASDVKHTDLFIIPNPVADLTQLRYTIAIPGRTRLEVADDHGKRLEVLEEAVRAVGTFEHSWNTRFLAPGMYHVTLLVDGAPLVKKAVKVAR